ncbi:MAG: ParB/RepB/Spo0J family partition protein [Bacteroidetes bacterium]|nr:ParB/RepB/Spo0J family partition protein [Bacteroidota bacterium]
MKPGLGRGLDALINPNVKKEVDEPMTISSKDIKTDDGKTVDLLAKIPTDKISPNPYQPRLEFDEKALDELKKSILQNGLIQPITVRRHGGNRYELISGERRLRACKDIGYKEIPAYIIKVDTPEAMLALSLIENIQREKLNAIEIAKAYKRLMDECSLTQEEISEKVGKDRTTVANSIRLLKLPHKVQVSLSKEEISAGHARALINLPNSSIQIEILEQIKSQQLSVRKVEALVKKYLLRAESSKVTRESSSAKRGDLSSISQRDLEDKIMQILGTKVHCKIRKDGTGEIIIEFYSNDELERLYDLFSEISKG